jgi:methionyl-tRNA formyltransferase
MRTRIVFIMPEEPSVVAHFFRRLMPQIEDQIAAIAVVSPIYKNSSWFKQAKRFVGAFGLRAFVSEGIRFAADVAADRANSWLGIGNPRSIKGLARERGLRVIEPDNVNDPEFLATLRDIDPDLIISVSCPQIFKRELLELPKITCVNVHSSLLPHYRGILPTFWVLANDEKETGVSVMYMNPGIDDGNLIVQGRIPIAEDETLRSLMHKCKSMAADLVLETIRSFENDSVNPLPNPEEEGSYFSFPKREDVSRFRALGRAMR